jgi:hypothetical protein
MAVCLLLEGVVALLPPVEAAAVAAPLSSNARLGCQGMDRAEAGKSRLRRNTELSLLQCGKLLRFKAILLLHKIASQWMHFE